MTASVVLGNESSVQMPIQVVDATFGSVPRSCGIPDTNPVSAGFNGILGVGPLAYDCGQICVSTAVGQYYSCRGTTCSGTAVPLSNQVPNPVAVLPSDNNGLIVQLPAISAAGASSVSGSLVLGIGTKANNTPSGVTTFTVDQYNEFTTTYRGAAYSGFIDTGSNGLFFPASGLITSCSSGWFCPSSVMNLSAGITGSSGSPNATVSFQIGNFNSLTNSANNVFNDIGGDSMGSPSFDWGLPFYFGRNVFIGIDGKTSSLGTGPYFAY
ncbi:MAG: DUF3443 family protein [Nitrospirae bacterium]|nr:DUF3443 family protein [Nitrospirota bacterium]